MATIALAPHSPLHDDYALRLHLQVVNVIDAPSLQAISQFSLLLSVLATCADITVWDRNDPAENAIAATANILNRMAGRSTFAPNAEESRVLIACSGVLDRLFRRYPAARLQMVEASVRMLCERQLEAA